MFNGTQLIMFNGTLFISNNDSKKTTYTAQLITVLYINLLTKLKVKELRMSIFCKLKNLP